MANTKRLRTNQTIDGTLAVGGTFSVAGASSMAGITATTFSASGAASFAGGITGGLSVAGNSTFANNVDITGDLTVGGSFSFAGGSVFPDNTFAVQDNVDATKQMMVSLGGATTGTATTLTFIQSVNRAVTFPDLAGTVALTSGAQTLTNKSLQDSTTFIVDDGDATKVMKFDAAAIATATTRTLSMPDADVNLGALTNSNIDAAAAIARTKIANGTASHVVINNGSGTLSSEAALSASRGGLGADASAFTGVVKASSGVFSAASLVNADVDAAAAIARSKLASGTAAHVLINDGTGVMSSEASLAETRGGTAQTTYTAGDMLYASASNTLSKRAIGTPGQILKTGDAGIPVWEDTNYPTQETRLFEDWHGDAVGTLRWLDADTGTGASATGLTVSDTTRHGVLELDTGASSTGAAIRYLGGVTSGTGTAGFKLGGGLLTMEWSVRVEDLSTAGERYSFMLGLFSTTATQVDAVRFIYNDSINAGNWTISTINASTVTNTDSGIAVAADTWYKLRAVVNAAATSVEYFINDVSVGTVTTNIPTVNIAPRASMAKTVGTAARMVYVDYFRLYQRLTSSR
jgi:hypothetical protein